MNATTLQTLRIGDFIYSNFGMMCGEDFGTVIGFEKTPWGDNVWIRRSDFSLTTISHLNGTVTVKTYIDYEGTPHFSARPLTGSGIGPYLVVN